MPSSKGDKWLHSWAFTNLANARNDGLLVLDEIGQANARQVSQTAYSVINNVSKVQGAKEGGNRESTRWKTLLFSTQGKSPLTPSSDGTAKTGTRGRPPACRAYPATRGRDWASTTACTASRTARH